MNIMSKFNRYIVKFSFLAVRNRYVNAAMLLFVLGIVIWLTNNNLLAIWSNQISQNANKIYVKAKPSFAQAYPQPTIKKNNATTTVSVVNSVWIKPRQFSQNYDRAKLSALAIFLNIPLSELYYKMKSSYRCVYLSHQVDESIARRVTALDLVGIYSQENSRHPTTVEEKLDVQTMAFNHACHSRHRQNFSLEKGLSFNCTIVKARINDSNVELDQLNGLSRNKFIAHLKPTIPKQFDTASQADKKNLRFEVVLDRITNDNQTELFSNIQVASFSPTTPHAFPLTILSRGV